MKKIKDFLFVEQSFYDAKETKPAVVNTNFIDNITCKNDEQLGGIVVIETDNTRIMVKDTDNTFFTELEEILENDEEEW